jgi:hypothetical protein
MALANLTRFQNGAVTISGQPSGDTNQPGVQRGTRTPNLRFWRPLRFQLRHPDKENGGCTWA